MVVEDIHKYKWKCFVFSCSCLVMWRNLEIWKFSLRASKGKGCLILLGFCVPFQWENGGKFLRKFTRKSTIAWGKGFSKFSSYIFLFKKNVLDTCYEFSRKFQGNKEGRLSFLLERNFSNFNTFRFLPTTQTQSRKLSKIEISIMQIFVFSSSSFSFLLRRNKKQSLFDIKGICKITWNCNNNRCNSITWKRKFSRFSSFCSFKMSLNDNFKWIKKWQILFSRKGFNFSLRRRLLFYFFQGLEFQEKDIQFQQFHIQWEIW